MGHPIEQLGAGGGQWLNLKKKKKKKKGLAFGGGRITPKGYGVVEATLDRLV
jgi:hypothetical protein